MKEKETTLNPWNVKKVDLDFVIKDKTILVTNELFLEKKDKNTTEIELLGESINLISIKIDNRKIISKRYEKKNKYLIIKGLVKKKISICIHSKMPIANNKKCGLNFTDRKIYTPYRLDNFHRITYFPTGPIFPTFLCKITASKNKYPHLLSDGKIIKKGENKNTHWVIWEDTTPKSSYLFSLVAGKFAVQKEKYSYENNKNVDIFIYLPEKYKDYCNYVLDCIKKIFYFNEFFFHLPIYFQTYQIVGLKNFDTEEIEGKNLNFFNVFSLLANPQVSTDLEYIRIDKILARRYFFSWRFEKDITKNWFYFSFFQGLALFQLQEYLNYKYSKNFQKIEYVKQYKKLQTEEKYLLAPDKFFALQQNHDTNYFRMFSYALYSP